MNNELPTTLIQDFSVPFAKVNANFSCVYFCKFAFTFAYGIQDFWDNYPNLFNVFKIQEKYFLKCKKRRKDCRLNMNASGAVALTTLFYALPGTKKAPQCGAF